MSSDEPMVMLTCRVPRMLRDRVDELKAASGAEDRSEVVRRLLADGTRRALAAAHHPARLPDDHQDPAAGAGVPDPAQPGDALPRVRSAAGPARRAV